MTDRLRDEESDSGWNVIPKPDGGSGAGPTQPMQPQKKIGGRVGDGSFGITRVALGFVLPSSLPAFTAATRRATRKGNSQIVGANSCSSSSSFAAGTGENLFVLDGRFRPHNRVSLHVTPGQEMDQLQHPGIRNATLALERNPRLDPIVSDAPSFFKRRPARSERTHHN